MQDVVIIGGTVFDGTGAPGVQTDVAIKNSRITKLGKSSAKKGATVIDATGKYVAPGVIDIANRSDTYWRLFTDPTVASMLFQGVTTMIGGNSGASLAPMHNKDMLLATQKWADVTRVNVGWDSMESFLQVVAASKVVPNFGTFVGYGTLRRGLVGDEATALSDRHLRVLRQEIAAALDEGALGVSLGLGYVHAQGIMQEELQMIGEIAAYYDVPCVVHLRDEGDDVLHALEEALSIVTMSGARVHITHLKTIGPEQWGKTQKALERLSAFGEQEGVEITFDFYPYATTGSVFYTLLPTWINAGGRQMMLRRLREVAPRAQAEEHLAKEHVYLKDAIVAIGPKSSHAIGKTIGAVAAEMECSVESAAIDLLLASQGRLIVLAPSLSIENVLRKGAYKTSIMTTNAAGYSLEHEGLQGVHMHPRSFGAVPTFFDLFVRQKQALTWEEAIFKCTGAPAACLGLRDRGVLRAGAQADVMVFDPEAFAAEATMAEPHQYATGLSHLLIGGNVIIDDGTLSAGAHYGTVVRRTR